MAHPPRDSHDDLANHASGLVVEVDFAIKLLRQPALDQARSEALAARRCHRRPAAFLPEQPHPVALRGRLNLPSNVDLPRAILRERAVLRCIGRQLVEHHGEGQHRFRSQANVVALDRETGTPGVIGVIETKGLQDLIDHVAQAHPVPVLAPKQAMSL